MSEPSQRVLRLYGRADRREGVTTALLDVALSNGRRGEQVVFYTINAAEAALAYRVAADLLCRGCDMEVDFDSKDLVIRWPSTERGMVRFGSHESRLLLRGFRASVVVMDEARWNDPEPVHAHTLIVGG